MHRLAQAAGIVRQRKPSVAARQGNDAAQVAIAPGAIDQGRSQQRGHGATRIGGLRLQGGLQLIPGASATDGLLDFIIASPEGTLDFASMADRCIVVDQGRVVADGSPGDAVAHYRTLMVA